MRPSHRLVCFFAFVACLAASTPISAQQIATQVGLIEEAALVAETDSAEYASAATSSALCPTGQPAGECNCPACQAAKKAADLKKAVASAYRSLSYQPAPVYVAPTYGFQNRQPMTGGAAHDAGWKIRGF